MVPKCQNQKKMTLHIFVPDLTVFEMLEFQIVDVKNLGQGRGVQHSQ